MSSTIFMTGATGCVGRYVVDSILAYTDHRLDLLIRNPAKVPAEWKTNPRIRILHDDLLAIQNRAENIKKADFIIHLATDWGGNPDVNDRAATFIFETADPERVKKIIYFSTASVLNEKSNLSEIAGTYGPPYVRTKYHFQKKLRALPLYDRTLTLYLTSLIGGDDTIPHSHVVEGIPKVITYLKFVRFLHADASFHFIHAADAGRITAYLLDSSIQNGEFVLGNSPVTISQALDALAQARRMPAPFHIPLSAGFLRGLAKLFKVQMDPWTEYHLDRRHFTFDVKDAAAFGLTSRYKNLDDLIRYFRELNLI